MTLLLAQDLSGQTASEIRPVVRRRSKRTRKSTARRRWVCAKCEHDHGAIAPEVCSCGSKKFAPERVRIELRVEPGERDRWKFCAQREGYLGVSDWIRDVCNGRVKSRVLTSSDLMTHNTPAEFLRVLRPMGRIALDPASNAGSIVRSRFKWTEEDDSLPRSWRVSAPGYVYVNPPYGDALPIWIRKMIEQAQQGVEILGLVPVRSDTAWFDLAQASADVGLWKGRITFRGAAHPAPFASCVLYFGPRRALFRKTIAPHCVRVLDATAPVWRKPKGSAVLRRAA